MTRLNIVRHNRALSRTYVRRELPNSRPEPDGFPADMPCLPRAVDELPLTTERPENLGETDNPL
jgi:hypothetical protein